ncbi:MAG: ABC transporter ATP-binding protein [Ignisphaera sp.]
MVLAVKSLKLYIGYELDEGIAWVVEDLNMSIESNTTYCLIGESGCGKSTIGNAIAGLLPPYAYTYGKLIVMDKNVIDEDVRRFNGIRGKIVVKIPQDPASALNPYMTIGDQLDIAVKNYFRNLSDREVKAKTLELLSEVMLDREVYDMYPHQLSGGMKQRAAIALALAPEPKIIVADEPTSSLDAYLKHAIASLLKKLQREWELTMIFITHEIPIAQYVCNRVAVIYAGRIVEEGFVSDVLQNPRHPYVELLLKAYPKRLNRERLTDIPGMPPPPGRYPQGCKFAPRCPYVFDRCRIEEPPLIALGNCLIRCWRYYE